jgi:hypothetical protein
MINLIKYVVNEKQKQIYPLSVPRRHHWKEQKANKKAQLCRNYVTLEQF